jgi:hypothetical protein
MILCSSQTLAARMGEREGSILESIPPTLCYLVFRVTNVRCQILNVRAGGAGVPLAGPRLLVFTCPSVARLGGFWC